MNKQEVEKRYDEIFGSDHHKICEGKYCQCHKEVKDFIFSEVIPGVLKDFLPKVGYADPDWTEREKGEYAMKLLIYNEFKQKAKDLYQINLDE